jgi:hypothetical protein
MASKKYLNINTYTHMSMTCPHGSRKSVCAECGFVTTCQVKLAPVHLKQLIRA